MNNLFKLLVKTAAGFLFVGLLVMNVQIGSGETLLNVKDNSLNKAKAGNCDPGSSKCSVYEFPDGKKYWEYGKVVVVTPEVK